MSMMGEIEKLMESADASINYRIVNLGGSKLYIEGIKNVVAFGESEMQFQMKKCLIIVCGDTLKVKYLDKTTCIISGKISKVESR